MGPTLDDAFHALAHPDRRRLLTALVEDNSQANDTIHVPEDIPIENTEKNASNYTIPISRNSKSPTLSTGIKTPIK